MGQHKTNPVAQAAKRGELKPKPINNIAVAALSALTKLFFPFNLDPFDVATPANSVARSVLERRRARRRSEHALVAKLARRTHLYPPQQGHRRLEFSSATPGEWSDKSAA